MIHRTNQTSRWSLAHRIAHAERRADKKEEKQQAREEKKELKEQQKQGVNVNSDFSSLEKRLKNIELLLMGPLEVKIKN